MTRATGATDEQITAAAKDYFNQYTFDGKTWDNANELRKSVELYEASEWAARLVRPDQRIVEVADLRAVTEMAQLWADDRGGPVDQEAIDRITALIGDAE